MVPSLWRFVEDEARREGYNGSSAMLADLARQRRRERELVAMRLTEFLGVMRPASNFSMEEAKQSLAATTGTLVSSPSPTQKVKSSASALRRSAVQKLPHKKVAG